MGRPSAPPSACHWSCSWPEGDGGRLAPQQVNIAAQVRFENSPEVLAHKAREMPAALGYPDRAATRPTASPTTILSFNTPETATTPRDAAG